MTKRRRSQNFFPIPGSGFRMYGPAWFMLEGLINKGRHAKGRDIYRGEGETVAARERMTQRRRTRRRMTRESRRRNRT